MHHIINTGSTANRACTQEDGEAFIEEEEKEVVEKGAEYKEDDEPVVAAAPAATTKGRRSRRPRREETAEVQSGDLWRMNAVVGMTNGAYHGPSYLPAGVPGISTALG
jgi:hypothetical protein